MAAPMYALIAELESLVKCPVCLNQFNDPRSLQCQHTFCMSCLEVLRGNINKTKCPCCQQITPLPDGVSELPVDFRANSWLEIISEYEKAKAAQEAEAEAAAAVEEVEAAEMAEIIKLVEAAEVAEAAEALEAVQAAEAAAAMAHVEATLAQFPRHSSDVTHEACHNCGILSTNCRKLSCGHVLCVKCVQFLLPVGGNALHCPTCARQTVIVPPTVGNPGISLQVHRPDNSSGNRPPVQELYDFLARSPRPPAIPPSPNMAASSRPAQDDKLYENQSLFEALRVLLSETPGQKAPVPPHPNNGSAPGLPSDTLYDQPYRWRSASASSQHEENQQGSKLTFHPRCGTEAVVHPNQITAHRRNAEVNPGDGILLTSRHLKPNEIFEVRLDSTVNTTSLSMQMGVTTHSPVNLDFPCEITRVTSGTWVMTGCVIRHNGAMVNDQYGQNLNRLKMGDRVAVQRRASGCLHFYVNGVDQGVAATRVPAEVYGVLDLYGRAEQATIVNRTAKTPDSSESIRPQLPLPPNSPPPLPAPRSPLQHSQLTSAQGDGTPRDGGSLSKLLSTLEGLTIAIQQQQHNTRPMMEAPRLPPPLPPKRRSPLQVPAPLGPQQVAGSAASGGHMSASTGAPSQRPASPVYTNYPSSPTPPPPPGSSPIDGRRSPVPTNLSTSAYYYEVPASPTASNSPTASTASRQLELSLMTVPPIPPKARAGSPGSPRSPGAPQMGLGVSLADIVNTKTALRKSPT